MRRHVALWLLFLLPWTAVARPGAIPGLESAALAEGHALYLPWLGKPPPAVVIAAAYIDSSRSGEADEAILLWNTGTQAELLRSWQIESNGRRTTVAADSALTLLPGQRLWLAAGAFAFRQTFGEPPGAEWAGDTDLLVEDLDGKITLTNGGGTLRLLDAHGDLVDVLVYGDEYVPADGWDGPPAQLYTRGLVTAQGQVWQRKRDPQTDLPVDTGRAEDWAGDLGDAGWGRQIRWPGWGGWDAAGWAQPRAGTATGNLLLAVGPEGIYAPVAQALVEARRAIDLSIYTLEHPQLAQLLADAAGRGVQVRVLLDGAPPGGITKLQKWCVAQVAAAGGDVRYFALADDAPSGIKRRYRYVHAKYGIVDGRVGLVMTENFSQDAMPVTEEAPAGGRRGFALVTDAAGIVAALAELFAVDWAPQRFYDLRRYAAADPKYGAPPADFVPAAPHAWDVDAAPFGEPLVVQGAWGFSLVTAPENTFRPDTGMLGLLREAGPGDEVTLVQLYEQRHWGPVTSNPLADPNPRLEALIAAARRGARVRILLDSFFDDPADRRSNAATVAYINDLAAQGGLALEARAGNPTAGGIHAKVLLARIGGRTWSAVGSLNGGEVSCKLNREVVLLVDAPAVYDRLLAVFEHDWVRSGNEAGG